MSLPTKHLEAVLFSAAKPISQDMLADVFELSEQEISDYIKSLQSELELNDRGDTCSCIRCRCRIGECQ